MKNEKRRRERDGKIDFISVGWYLVKREILRWWMVEARLISWNRGSKVITKALEGICDFARLPSNCQPPTFWVSAYLTGCPKCVHTYACTHSPFLSLCMSLFHSLPLDTLSLHSHPPIFFPFFIHCFLVPAAACFWCFRSCWKIFAWCFAVYTYVSTYIWTIQL